MLYTQFYLLKIRHNPIKGVEISDVASLFSNIEDFRESHVRFASAFKAAVDSTEWPFINAGGALLAAVRVMQHWPSVDATRGWLSARRWSNDTPLVGWLVGWLCVSCPNYYQPTKPTSKTTRWPSSRSTG